MRTTTSVETHTLDHITEVFINGRRVGYVWPEPKGWAASLHRPEETESYLTHQRPTRGEALAWLVGPHLAKGIQP